MTNLARVPLRPLALVACVTLSLRTASRGDTPAAPPVGALTLEPAPSASLLNLLTPWLRPVPAQGAYDMELSDSFTRTAVRAVRQAEPNTTAPRRTLPVAATSAPRPAPAAAITAATPWDFSVSVVAPASATAPNRVDLLPAENTLPATALALATTFAADMLTAPARTQLVNDAAANWLAPAVTAVPAWRAQEETGFQSGPGRAQPGTFGWQRVRLGRRL